MKITLHDNPGPAPAAFYAQLQPDGTYALMTEQASELISRLHEELRRTRDLLQKAEFLAERRATQLVAILDSHGLPPPEELVLPVPPPAPWNETVTSSLVTTALERVEPKDYP